MKKTNAIKNTFAQSLRLLLILSTLFSVLLISPSCDNDDNEPDTPSTTTSNTTSANTSGTTSGTISSTNTKSVSIVDFSFSPSSTTISVGETVTWTNNSSGTPHTVTSNQGLFDSGNLNAGSTFSFTFITVGTYTYYCRIHPQMVGTIIVQ